MKLKENIQNRISGITSLESIVYLAIFSVIFLTMIQYLFSVGRYNGLAEESIMIQKNALFVSSHFKESFSKTIDINIVESTFNNDLGVLTLNISDSGQVVETAYQLSNGKIIYTNQNGISTTITQSDVFVNRLRFEPIYNVNDELVGTRLIMDISSENYNLTDGFETSYIILSQVK